MSPSLRSRYLNRMKEVTVYSTKSCPWCRKAEQFLTAQGVPFTTIDVTDDDAMRDKLVQLSGGMRTVPQIFVGDSPIGGYTDLIALHQKGELNRLLELENTRKLG